MVNSTMVNCTMIDDPEELKVFSVRISFLYQ